VSWSTVMGHDDVAFHVEVEGCDAELMVRSVRIEETLNSVSSCSVHARADSAPSVEDLHLANARVTLERTSQRRSFKGIVRHARVRELDVGCEVELSIVPAVWLLSQIVDTRIYQNMTVLEIVEEVFYRVLSGPRRTVRNLVQASYEPREYTTQYQESTLAFLSRLTEEEGIFWFFDHESEDQEVLVLADGISGLSSVRESDEGRVPYAANPDRMPDHEAVLEMARDEHVGATDVVLAEFDWTNPGALVRGEQTGRGTGAPALEVYDHTDAIALSGYAGGRYGANTASAQARIRAERLDLARQSWSMSTTVVTAQPGLLIEVQGYPEGDFDQRYLIVRASGHGTATEGGRGGWQSASMVVPTSIPYRPARKTRKPVVAGPETAVVVGPSGEEIHTDEHGRVRVHFHWDRVHPAGSEQSSCWLRVKHNWAGAGFGTLFIPRIGMEVVVEFLGGNPDRPIVTGAVYNADNQPPCSLPADKSQSTIKTNSTPGGGGFNELRFEDKAGSEEVFLHAQRNLLERILHDHTTHVGHDQRDTVDNDQELTVHGDRTKTVDGDETTVVKGTRHATIGQDGGNDRLRVVNNQEIQVDGNRELLVAFGETIEVRGIQESTIGSVTSTVRRGITQTIEAGGWTMTTTGNVGHTISGALLVDTSDAISLGSGADVNVTAARGITLSGQSITLQATTEVVVNAPAGIRNVTPAAQTDVLSQLMETIHGKFAAYTLYISLVGVSVSMAGFKTEAFGAKFDESGFKLSKGAVEIGQGLTRISKRFFESIG
jgi:type VI secretion system secreted protein VgrG